MKIQSQHRRQGTVVVFLCFLMVPLIGLLAFSVDYGFLLYMRTDLQRSSDQAALAAVRDLLPDANGSQDLNQTRQTVRSYTEMNQPSGFTVQDSDIEIGRFDRNTVYNSVQLLNTGILDTTRVTVRRDSSANSSVSLYFARIFDRDHEDVTATSTAILQPARYLGPGTPILPIALQQTTWNKLDFGHHISVYGDGRIEDGAGKEIPGNWGTVDIGAAANSASDLRDQINEGLRQSDLNSLYQQGVISDPAHIDSQAPITVNGDTGFSAGIKHAVRDAHGSIRLMPIFKKTTGHGGNLTFDVVGWGAVEVIGSRFSGGQNSYLEVEKSYMYDAHLKPVNDLSDSSQAIEGAYASPVLVE